MAKRLVDEREEPEKHTTVQVFETRWGTRSEKHIFHGPEPLAPSEVRADAERRRDEILKEFQADPEQFIGRWLSRIAAHELDFNGRVLRVPLATAAETISFMPEVIDHIWHRSMEPEAFAHPVNRHLHQDLTGVRSEEHGKVLESCAAHAMRNFAGRKLNGQIMPMTAPHAFVARPFFEALDQFAAAAVRERAFDKALELSKTLEQVLHPGEHIAGGEPAREVCTLLEDIEQTARSARVEVERFIQAHENEESGAASNPHVESFLAQHDAAREGLDPRRKEDENATAEEEKSRGREHSS